MKRKLLVKLLLFVCVFGYQNAEAQIFKKKKKNTEQEANKPSKDKIQPYNKVITKDAVSDTGLFTTHVVDENHFLKFQIHYSIKKC